MGAIFVVSFIAALSGAVMPGPLLTVTIAQTARRGFIASVLLVLGHSVLELALVVGLVYGLGHFLTIRSVKGSVAVLGGAMLLWMGWAMIRDARRGSLEIHTEAEGRASERFGILRNPVISGVVVSLSNPYWLIWWATIGLAFFGALSRNALGAIAAFYFGHIMGDIVWYLAVGGAVATGRRLISPVAYRTMVQVCGVFLFFLGCSFLYLVSSGGLWDISMKMDWLPK